MYLGYISYALLMLLFWSIVYSISYTTKIWLILWISIVLSIMADISLGAGRDIISLIITLGIRGMFLYISYNLYINPKESYTYVRVLNNSTKTKTNQ